MKFLFISVILGLILILLTASCGKDAALVKTQASEATTEENACAKLNGNYTADDAYFRMKIENCQMTYRGSVTNNPYVFEANITTTSAVAGWMQIQIIRTNNWVLPPAGAYECAFSLTQNNELLSMNCTDQALRMKQNFHRDYQ